MSEEASEESPVAARRRIRRVLVVSSASDSDSDGSVVAGARRKRLRVVSSSGSDSSGSDSSGSDSSGSAVLARRRRLPALRDSADDSDASSDAGLARAPPVGTKRPDGFSSDSSEGNSDKCSICLLRFKDQEVGIPESCEHMFCLDCITEWSHNVNTCPVDRMTFNSIVVRICAGGKVLRTEPVNVTERRPSVEALVVEDPTHCAICGSAESEESMLLCDGCDFGFHMRCLTPPLTEIPTEDQWLCPNCREYIIDLSELDNLFMGLVEFDFPVGPRPSALREPRNVRRSARNHGESSVTSAGASTSWAGGSSDAGPSTSRGAPVGRRRGRRGAASAAPRRRAQTTRKRRYKRRRTKTVIIEYEVEQNGKFPITKTVKKKVRRKSGRRPRTAARRSLVRASVRAQLAALGRAGLARASLGPDSAGPDLGLRRHRAGIPALNLFGSPYDLDYVSGEELEERDGGDVVSATAARPSNAVYTAYRQARRKMISVPSPPPATSACNLLDSIMEGQELLHSRRSKVNVAADGRLEYRKLEAGAEKGRQAPAYPGQTGGGGGAAWGAPAGGGRGPGAGRSAGPPAGVPGRSAAGGAAPLAPGPACYERAPCGSPPRRSPPRYRPLPAPPAFPLPLEEDKYDPTEPTNDSGDEGPPPPLPEPRFSSSVLQGAVRQVLADHRLFDPSRAPPSDDDDDDDGDCPNFSIYSAASVHIASASSLEPGPLAPPPLPQPETEPEPETTPEHRTKEDEYKERLSRKCPITTNPRNPIKIKLNTSSLIKRPVSLYEDEDQEDIQTVHAEPQPQIESTPRKSTELDKHETSLRNDVPKSSSPEISKKLPPEEVEKAHEERNGDCGTPTLDDMPEHNGDHRDDDRDDDDDFAHEDVGDTDEKLEDMRSEDEAELQESETVTVKEGARDKADKLTESISETEDERSYTPCLDENKSKDTSLETDRDKALEGLDTELISEEEGNDMFSDGDKATSPVPRDKDDGVKKKRKKETKKESKDKKRKTDVSFKKLSKSGKERNYREREKDKDKDEKKSKKERAEALEAARRVRRQDLQRYDVRARLRRRRDPFGRDLRGGSRRRSSSPRRNSISPRRKSISPRRKSISPRRKSISPRRKSISPRRKSISPRRKSITPRRRSPHSRRRSMTPRRRSITPRKRSLTPRKSPITPRKRSASSRKRSISPRKRSITPRKRSITPRKRSITPRKRSVTPRKRSLTPVRRRSSSASPRRPPRRKKKKRAASPRAAAEPRRRRAEPAPRPEPRLEPRPEPRASPRRRRLKEPAPSSKEVFTSGDNILVSVSFKDQDRVRSSNDKRKKKDSKREKKKKRKRVTAPEVETSKPVAIIDLERSPFAEIATSPKNVIVLSDSDNNEPPPAPAAAPAAAEPPPAPAAAVGPKTPPSPGERPAAPPAEGAAGGPGTPPDSPDAYDPFEPTRSPSPGAMTLEARGCEEVLQRRAVSPLEKVLALLASTREDPPEPPPEPASLPEPARAFPPEPPRPLFPPKPSPIKSNPVKPMQAAKLPRPPPPGDSPYSPGSSDFGDLFEPPPPSSDNGGAPRDSFDILFDKLPKARKNKAAKLPKLNKKKGTKTQVGVKLDEDSMKILDDLPSSAVEMQVKNKFLKKLNRQERVVEEVKLVLKPHYNKKHVTKEEYKDILRRAVPKICHNKSGEINPTKIQALVEAYVKKFRKKHKLGLA